MMKNLNLDIKSKLKKSSPSNDPKEVAHELRKELGIRIDEQLEWKKRDTFENWREIRNKNFRRITIQPLLKMYVNDTCQLSFLVLLKLSISNCLLDLIHNQMLKLPSFNYLFQIKKCNRKIS